MIELMKVTDIVVTRSTVIIGLFMVIIVGVLFWLRSKEIQIRTLKSQINFLVRLVNENFIEILIEREKDKNGELRKLKRELAQLKEEAGVTVDHKVVKEKEREIRTIKSSAEATTNAINSALDCYSTNIHTIGSMLNLRKEIKEDSFIAGDEWKGMSEKNRRGN